MGILVTVSASHVLHAPDTWDMLPEYLKTGDIVDYVCREIGWVRGQLLGTRAPAAAALAT